MTRAFTIFGPESRRALVRLIEVVPLGTRVQINDAKRSVEQNSLMWALLTEVSQQLTHCGKRYEPDQWKAIFMHGLGQEIEFLHSLDGKTFVPYGARSSKLSAKDMTALIEFILAEGTMRGVKFADELMQGAA